MMDTTDGDARVLVTHLPNLSGARAWSVNAEGDGEPVADEVTLVGFMVRTYHDENGVEDEEYVSPIVYPAWGRLVVQAGPLLIHDVDGEESYRSLKEAAAAVAERRQRRAAAE
jgi:hypothetical protein